MARLVIAFNFMPLNLDEIDVSILKSLIQDGRKSFRQISRDTGITTPTVKARYERLVNVGFIKGVIPIFDFEKIDSKDKNYIHLQSLRVDVKKKGWREKNQKNIFKKEINEIQGRIASGFTIKITCDYWMDQSMVNLGF